MTGFGSPGWSSLSPSNTEPKSSNPAGPPPPSQALLNPPQANWRPALCKRVKNKGFYCRADSRCWQGHGGKCWMPGQTRHTDRPTRFKAQQKSRFLWDVGRKEKGFHTSATAAQKVNPLKSESDSSKIMKVHLYQSQDLTEDTDVSV